MSDDNTIKMHPKDVDALQAAITNPPDPSPKLVALLREPAHPHCCKIGCGKDADFEIWHGPRHDDYTHACLEHIPDLMTDATTHTVNRIPRG